MNKYFLFFQGDDGLYIRQGTKEDMEKEIEECFPDYEFENEFPKSKYSTTGVILDEFKGPLLIEGHVVIPKKVEVVTKYEL